MYLDKALMPNNNKLQNMTIKTNLANDDIYIVSKHNIYLIPLIFSFQYWQYGLLFDYLNVDT